MTAIDDGVQTQTKVCRMCSVEKPLTEFYAHKHTRDGLQTFCKQCSKDHNTRRYALEKKGSPFIKRSVRFLRNQVDPSELSHEELVGGFIYEDDGTKCDTGSFEDKAKAKFQKELSRRLQRYIKDKTPRALEVIFSIIDSDLVEPADRLKASQWWVERIIGKTPEKLEMSVSEAPHEAIFENLVGGSRAQYRAAIGNAIDAEIVSDDQMEAEQSAGQPLRDTDDKWVDTETEVLGQTDTQRNNSSSIGTGPESDETVLHDIPENRAESDADQIVNKRKEAESLKKRIAEQKRKRYAGRAVGATSLHQVPWLIDWRVDAEGLRACLVSPAALTPARIATIEAHDAETADIALIAIKRANQLAAEAEKAKQRLERLKSNG